VTGATARPTPCASCPYRQSVPSGLWAPEEYAKLPGYDGDTMNQTPNMFLCHQQDGCACAGWLGHREHPADLLAVRIGILSGTLDESCADYTTDVPLFASGADAAAHGLRDVEEPGEAAATAISKLLRQREARA
jgi:hypothetical protein